MPSLSASGLYYTMTAIDLSLASDLDSRRILGKLGNQDLTLIQYLCMVKPGILTPCKPNNINSVLFGGNGYIIGMRLFIFKLFQPITPE